MGKKRGINQRSHISWNATIALRQIEDNGHFNTEEAEIEAVAFLLYNGIPIPDYISHVTDHYINTGMVSKEGVIDWDAWEIINLNA